MANNKQKSENQAKLYWVFTAFMLLTATPIGIILILFKLMETKKQGKPQIDYDTPVGAKTTAGTWAQSRAKRTDVLTPMHKKAEHRIKVGGVLTAIFALVFATCVGDGLMYLPGDPMWFLEEIWFPLCAAVSSGLYLGTGLRLRKQVRRFRNYLSMIGHRHTISVGTLATAANRSADKVRADLETMLDEGILSEGFLDYRSDQLILSSEGLHDTPSAQREKQTPKQTEEDRDNALLAEIRAVNDLVKNEKLSAQIDQIGLLTAKILDYEKSHPQSAPQLHSFLSYYLPTTLKILRAYGQLEAQEVSGENITAAMKRIEDMMDKVVEGFEKQLDQLFLGETMDITSDVEVLERMLAKDGLSGQGITLNL